MTPDEGRPSDVFMRAAEIVGDALHELRELRAEADLSTDQEYAIAAALFNAVKRGVQLGAVETTAQAIEQGVELDLRLDIGDDVSLDDLKP